MKIYYEYKEQMTKKLRHTERQQSNKEVTLNSFQGLFMARFYKIYGLNFLFYFDYRRDAEINSV